MNNDSSFRKPRPSFLFVPKQQCRHSQDIGISKSAVTLILRKFLTQRQPGAESLEGNNLIALLRRDLATLAKSLEPIDWKVCVDYLMDVRG
jgi:hypothetical protein